MKKQIKFLLMGVAMAIIIMFIATTTVHATTYEIHPSYSVYDENHFSVSFALPEDITDVESLTEDGWTVDGKTAVKNMQRGETYYYSQTKGENDKFCIIVAVPMKCELDETIALSESYTDISIDNTEIAEVHGYEITPIATGSTKLRAKKASRDGTIVDYVWDLTVVDSSINSHYYDARAWEILFPGEEAIELNVGDEKNVSITAEFSEEGYPTTPTNPFVVEWGVENDSIASITPNTGDKITNSGTIGSAKLNALTPGTTTVLATVKMQGNSNTVVTFAKRITVSGTSTEDNADKAETESGDNTENKDKEATTGSTDENGGVTVDDKKENEKNVKNGTEATEKFAKTGSNVAIVLFVIAGFGIVAIISKKKMTKNKF